MITSKIFMPEPWNPETHRSNEINWDGVFAEHGRSAAALGANRDPRAIEPLVAALIDENEGVRKAAGESLDRIDRQWANSPAAKAAVMTLLPALEAKDFERRRAAARALEAIGDRRAAAALGKIGDIRAVDALIDAMGSAPARRARRLLVSLLEMKSADLSEPQLRALARRRTIEIGTGQMICATGVEETRSVECSPYLSQLARQELLRGGLEA